MNKEITLKEFFKMIENNNIPKTVEYLKDIYIYNEDEEVYINDCSEDLFLKIFDEHLLSHVFDAKITILDENNDEFEDIEELDLIEVGSVIDFGCESNLHRAVLNELIRNQKKIIERLNKDESKR